MDQNRTDMPNRSSNMEQAEGSRDNVDSESMRSAERMRNQSSGDRGSSSDRAMFSDRDSAEERDMPDDSQPATGGITNRGLDVERSEQERLPARGHSQSDETER